MTRTATCDIPDASNLDTLVIGKDLESLSDYLLKLSNEIKEGKWPNAAAVVDGNLFVLVLEGVWERQ